MGSNLLTSIGNKKLPPTYLSSSSLLTSTREHPQFSRGEPSRGPVTHQGSLDVHLSPAWANDKLRYAIRLLHGLVFHDFGSTLSIVIYLKNYLDDEGFRWQSHVLEIWIDKAIRNGGFLPVLRPPERANVDKAEGGSL